MKRKRLRRTSRAGAAPPFGEWRDVPLSLLFAGLLTNCGHMSGDCGGPITFAREVVVNDAELQYFAGEDGYLDMTDCVVMCRCIALGYRPPAPTADAGTPLDASDEGGTEEAGSDAAMSLDADAYATDHAESTDGASVAADASEGGNQGGGGGTGGSTGAPAGFRTCGGSRSVRIPNGLASCASRGSEPDRHTFRCTETEPAGVSCGRDSACHERLGLGFGDTDVARWLAFAAAMEAASIRSFVTLRRELSALGAPADLVARAHRAARDEARHTRLMSRLARERGGRTEWPRSVRLPPRDLEAVATENAVEGCVHETWSALLGTYQASHAADPEVRDVMAHIAADETAHAELARDIDRWAMATLPKSARVRVRRRRQMAARALVARLREPAGPLRADLGLPSLRLQQHFADQLMRPLWS